MVYWYDFVYSPAWFNGKDIIIDVVSAIVVLMISFFSLKNCMMDRKNKKHLFLAGAFAFIGISFLVKIAANIMSHTEHALCREIMFSILGTPSGSNQAFFAAIAFLLHVTFMLFGFYTIYVLSSKDELSMNYVLIAYFIIIMTYFVRFNYFFFYLTAFLFLLAISRRYFLQYRKTKYKNTLLLGISFSIITLSQFIFIFTIHNNLLYVMAEVVQLIGYLFLLYTFTRVLKACKVKEAG